VLASGDAAGWGGVGWGRCGPGRGGAAATAQAVVRHSRVVAAVRRRLEDTTHQRLGNIGTVDTLSVLPLVDRGVQRPGLRASPASPTWCGPAVRCCCSTPA
jgi:hypothetical protein